MTDLIFVLCVLVTLVGVLSRGFGWRVALAAVVGVVCYMAIVAGTTYWLTQS